MDFKPAMWYTLVPQCQIWKYCKAPTKLLRGSSNSNFAVYTAYCLLSIPFLFLLSLFTAAIFTQGIMISVVGITLHTRHLYYRFCRVLEFEESPEYAEIENGVRV